MKCPVCSKEMEQGFLQGNQRIAWVKRQHNVSILPREGEVLLENRAFGSFLYPAWICKGCQNIVLNYSDKTRQED